VRRLLASPWLFCLAASTACTEPAPVAKAPAQHSRAPAKVERIFARLSRGTVGPYLARRADGLLALWAGPEGDDFDWFARAFEPSGRPAEEARQVAAVNAVPGLVRLVPFGQGYLAAWSGTDKGQPILFSLALGRDGRLLAPPQALPQPEAAPLWLEVAPTSSGGLLLWAEPSGALARVLVMELDEAGAPASNPTELPGPARAWQAVPSGKGAVALLVDERRGLRLVQVSERGEVLASREVPGAGPVGNDVDLGAEGDRLLYAFTQASPIDDRVFVGVSDLDGNPAGVARPAVPPFGEQRLLHLVAGGGGAFLVWQDTVQHPGVLHIGALGPDGIVTGEPVVLPWDGEAPAPEFSAAGGLHALAWACVESLDCSEPLLPAQIDFDPKKLEPKAVNPWFADGRVPDLAWDLRCGSTGCLGLGAVFGDPSHAYLLGSERAAGHWLTPAWKPGHSRPRARELAAAFEPLPLSDFDVLASDEGTLVGWLSYFDPAAPYVTPKEPAPDGRKAPVRAQLWTQWLPGGFQATGGEPLPEPTVISYRARSPGGVSLAPGQRSNLLVWTAIDSGVPQVFTTLVDAHGKKVAQQMLTRQKGTVLSVTAAAGEKGWVVGWIDDRTGTARPYLALLSDRLARKLPDQRIGADGPETTGIAVSLVGEQVWHVRSETAGGASGALTLARLQQRNLKPISELVLARDAASYRSPSLVPGASRPLVIAVRDGQDGSNLVVYSVDPTGAEVETPLLLKAQHAVVSYAAACQSDRCRLVANTESDEAQFVEAFTFSEQGVQGAERVATLVATSSLEIAPVVRRNDAWLYDLSTRGQPRISRLKLDW
jgi:hypothetical protein